MKLNKYWFKPKGLGYGATPTSWEGWLVTVILILYIFGIATVFIPEDIFNFYWYFAAGLAVFIILAKRKTNGKWQWNWSRK